MSTSLACARCGILVSPEEAAQHHCPQPCTVCPKIHELMMQARAERDAALAELAELRARVAAVHATQVPL